MTFYITPNKQHVPKHERPFFREGTPRTVLEAMATGRGIITTDAPGCRETVRGKVENRKSKFAGDDYPLMARITLIYCIFISVIGVIRGLFIAGLA